MKLIYILVFICMFKIDIIAQQQKKVTLTEVMNLAKQVSLDAFKAKNMYLAGYWEYQSYRARQLPNINLQLTPSSYNRMMTKRYDFENDVEVYREQQTLNSYSNISLSQNIPLTGGRIYFDSDFSRLVNFGNDKLTTYSVTPIRIGLEQPLFGFNRLKWEKKISPLQFEKAKQDYIHSQQESNIKALGLYFDLLLAIKKREIAESNYITADTLHMFGIRRFDIASIQQEELLDLELSKFNAEIELAQAEKDLEKSRFSLNSFLLFDENVLLIPSLPSVEEGLQISISEAVNNAINNNPEMLNLKQQELEAEQSLDKANKESRFSVNVSASYGLNQKAGTFNEAYQNPLDQQMVMLSLDIPILDWGERKGNKQMALKNKEVVDIEVRQASIDFQQKIALKVIDFNLQEKQLQSAAKADIIAQKSYELTKKRFMLGKADVLKLNNAMKARQIAAEKYITSLFTYWKYYYEVQQLTLYDFRNGVAIEEDFDSLLN